MSQHQNSKAKYYHGLNLMPSLGPVRIRKLLQHFGNAEYACKAHPDELAEIEGFSSALVERINQERDKINLDKTWEYIIKKGYACVTWEDEDYPLLLQEIYDPPPIIYYYGDIEIVSGCCLAIVGSRRHTLYGREIAYKFAAELSNYGLTIVSGMARGIDTWAHKGALEAGGQTVAVLGCGLDICYPPENRAIRDKIRACGVVISEFPPGSKPLPQNFPRRNRIISGLSQGTVVVEAGEKSGALITADFALEQGREVFAVPGSIASPYSKGCHRLLKEGAKLVEKVEDIIEELSLSSLIEELPSLASRKDDRNISGVGGVPGEIRLEPEEKRLLDFIPYEPLTLEEIVSLSQIPLSLVNALLLKLEMKGAIKQLPGKYFIRN